MPCTLYLEMCVRSQFVEDGWRRGWSSSQEGISEAVTAAQVTEMTVTMDTLETWCFTLHHSPRRQGVSMWSRGAASGKRFLSLLKERHSSGHSLLLEDVFVMLESSLLMNT